MKAINPLILQQILPNYIQLLGNIILPHVGEKSGYAFEPQT
jgi:hypothetical protein